MRALEIVNLVISILFTVCYLYQIVIFIPVSLLRHRKLTKKPVPHTYAVMICARNEENVIGDLLDSIANQTYDQSLVTVFVMADNCTDGTAGAARAKGVHVYERHDTSNIGKGYATKELMKHIAEEYPEGFDGYFVFDADNVLAPDYMERMNESFSEGYEIITCYRNSKNYGDNWISSGYSLWFLRESRYLMNARYQLGSSCTVSGTGFLFSRRVCEEMGPWPYHTLVEDIEFSFNEIRKGRKICYSPDAMVFDEQPVKFWQSCRQRLRWCRGYWQVFRIYGKDILKGLFTFRFVSYDMCMTIMPALVLSLICLVANVILGIIGICTGVSLTALLAPMLRSLVSAYVTMFLVGLLTLITEWKKVRTTAFKKIWSLFTFPVFMMTYVPIGMVSIFVKPQWKPVEHTRSLRKIREDGEAEDEIPVK